MNLADGKVLAPFPTPNAFRLHLARHVLLELTIRGLVRQLNVCLVDHHLGLAALLRATVLFVVRILLSVLRKASATPFAGLAARLLLLRLHYH